MNINKYKTFKTRSSREFGSVNKLGNNKNIYTDLERGPLPQET